MRYTVIYEGYLFYGDSKGVNRFDTNSWDEAIETWHAYHDGTHMEIRDNEYDVIFDGEWY